MNYIMNSVKELFCFCILLINPTVMQCDFSSESSEFSLVWPIICRHNNCDVARKQKSSKMNNFMIID